MTESEKQNFNIRLERLMNEGIVELKNIGIKPSDKIKSIIGNTRAQRRLGCCKKVFYGTEIGYEIEISTRLCNSSDFDIKKVILHELLHTCKGCLNHGKTWKQYAKLTNDRYGYNIRTTAELNEEQASDKFRYKIICMNCGQELYRIKKSPVVSHPENYRCSLCRGTLKVVNITKTTPN